MADSPILARWAEVDALFCRALDLAPGEQDAFVRAEAAGDAPLRDIVLSLLATCRVGAVPLGDGGASIPSELLADVLDSLETELSPAIGLRVGRYRLIRPIGRGGTGTVYLAERDDGEFEQRVAVKLLRRGLDTDDILARFRAERQILASMNHPNIARLLDGGATDDGRPYLVMELVDGRPITEYCDARRLTIEDRLALFAEVAAAVEYAHRSLVVHRDLKPSNILVADDGTVKLLDFGIAKLLDDAAADGSGALTRTGMRPMTPEYASPEQLRGAAITTASDVYQLGVLLHELCTGLRPEPPDSAGQSADSREPPRASAAVAGPPPESAPGRTTTGIAGLRRTDPRRLRARLRGDLDTIIATALRAAPERRYPTVHELAGDIERHRTGHPIAARPDRLHYRFRRFARRNPGGVAAAATAVLALFGYVAVLAVQAERLEAERDRARLEAARAREVEAFLLGIFEVADPGVTRGETVTARELLDAAASRVRTELTSEPDLQARMLTTIASVYARLGIDSEVGPLSREALDIRRGLHGDADPGTAENLLQLARLRPFNSPSADSLFEEALQVRERAYGPGHPLVADALVRWGRHLDYRTDEQHDRRLALFDRAVEILRGHDGDVRSQLAETLLNRVYGVGARIDPVPAAREALELRRDVYGTHSLPVARTLSDLALFLEHDDPIAADSLMRQALDIHRDLAGDAHTSTLTIANNLAGLLRDRDRFDQAEALYREVLAVRMREQPDERGRIAYTQFGLAMALLGQDRAHEAEPFLREALEPFPEGDVRREYVRRSLARSLAGQERYAEAESLLLASLDVIEAHWPGSGEEVPVLRELVDLYDRWGRANDAVRYRVRLQAADAAGAAS